MRSARCRFVPLLFLAATPVLAQAPATPEQNARQDAIVMLQGRATEEILPEPEIERVASLLLGVRKALPELAEVREALLHLFPDAEAKDAAAWRAWLSAHPEATRPR